MEARMRYKLVAVAAAAFFAVVATAQQPPATTTSSSPPFFSSNELFAVGTIPNATLHDKERNKDLAVAMEYPSRGGPYRVIVFSHGYGSAQEGYVALTEYWVGRGGRKSVV